jgi:23S rRNA (pseudouridine1915-N3)-methyltransferase
MKITLLFMGKTREHYLKEGIEIYIKRIRHYIPVEIKVIEERGKKTPGLAGKQEYERLISADGQVFVALLDEKGERFNSGEFAKFIEKVILRGYKELVFVTGDAWGLPVQLYKNADRVVSLSDMTLTHQMVRLLLAEQLYRAMTIIRGEPYHH